MSNDKNIAVRLEVAVLRGAIDLPDDVPDTPDNRRLFATISHDIAQMKLNGVVPDIPWEYADDTED